MPRHHLAPITTALSLLLTACSAHFAEPLPAATSTTPIAERCAALASAGLADVTIESASLQAANLPIEGTQIGFDPSVPGPQISGLPEFCRVVGRIQPEARSNIRFEVWLPSANWDGRFYGLGNGGFAGAINYIDLASAIRVGAVGASTDTGHTGSSMEAEWARGRPERIRDYGWRAVHLTTQAAKRLIERVYGRPAEHAYFMSCSNGGRQALMEATRFPDDYDGIVAGAPAAIFSDLALSMAWTVQAQLQEGAALRPEQMTLLQSEVLAQCDSLDSQTDGVLIDPRQCRFDASRLACGPSTSDQCFSLPQITALRAIMTGPHNAAGRRLANGYPVSGAEAGTPLPVIGWEGYITLGGAEPAGHSMLSGGILRSFATRPFADETTFNFDADVARLREATRELDVQPNLQRFFARGGRLILWHGWADAAISPQATIDFYEDALRNSGPRASESMRLFMAPGMQHCYGGIGATQIGQHGPPIPSETPDRNVNAAMLAWVETNRAPNILIGRQGGLMDVLGAGAPGGPRAPSTPTREYLLCAYPNEAHLRNGGDPASAADYVCQPPQ